MDAIGRTWQCGTIQLDMQLPERFGLEYTGEDGLKHRPVMIHRVVFGSIERFIGILIEHFAGAFPLGWRLSRCASSPLPRRTRPMRARWPKGWRPRACAPRQTAAMKKWAIKYARASFQKVPYMLVVGAKEMEDGTVSVRARKEENGGVKRLEEFEAQILEEIRTKAR